MEVCKGGRSELGELVREWNEIHYLSTFLLDGSTVNMNVDGSSTAVVYRYTVPSDKHVHVHRAFIVLEDGAAAFAPGNFGAIAGALSNGVEVSVTSVATKTVLETWTTNREIRSTMFDFDQQWRTDGQYSGRWTFTKDMHAKGITMHEGDKFDITIQDNLTGLDYFSFKIKGIISDAH